VGLKLGVKFVFARLLLHQGIRLRIRDDDGDASRTVSFRSKSTTRPPLSPVAR
jgi:hypothetical protein